MKKKFFNESGQTLIFVALGMTVMLGFVGFATDVGMLLHEQREVQTAADSAAIAGALEALNEGGATSINDNIKAAAINDATLNGFTNGSNGATVTVAMNSDITVPKFKTTGYVQATITQNTPDFFMKLFGFNTMNVSATAIATELGEQAPCMNVQNKGGAVPAVYMSGDSLIAASKCGIPVNGNLQFNGGAATIDAGFVGTTGTITGNAGVNINGPYATGVPPAPDPMAAKLEDSTKWPTPNGSGGCTATGYTCYYDFMGGNLTGPLNLNPGVYYFDEDVAISGAVSGTGVTIFMNGTHKFTFIQTNGTLDLQAPTAAGTFQNVLIDAPTDGPYTTCKSGLANNKQPGQFYFDFGSSNTTIGGILYAPYAELFTQDEGATLAFDADLVIGNVCMQSADFTINGLSNPAYSTKVGLVY